MIRRWSWSLWFPSSWLSLSLEEQLEIKCSFESGVLCIDDSFREDFITLNNLRKRHFIVMEWCCMYKKNRETIDHLLFHCEVARNLWVSIFRLFRIECVMHQRMVELLASWRSQFGSHYNIEVQRMGHLCSMWCIWRKYNARNFEL
jgi:hypothetical protein